MPLPDWLLTKAKDWGCVPQASIYFLKSSDIRGWSIETSSNICVRRIILLAGEITLLLMIFFIIGKFA